jgi:hypothetical protein
MAKQLRLSVQVDRLPDIVEKVGGKTTTHVQLGVRLSAAIQPPGPKEAADPALASDRDLVLPWHWRARTETADSWSPHVAELDKDEKDEKKKVPTWTLWHAPGGNPTKLEPIETWQPAETLLSDIDLVTKIFDSDRRFRTRLETEITDMLAQRGVAAALEHPASGVLRGRTVFGLVETLTSLPHPTPAGLNVWTVVAFDAATLKSALAEGDRFVAVPAFGTAQAIYTPQKPKGTGGDAPWTASYTPSDAKALGAFAEVRSSLGVDKLGIGKDQFERLIDASRLIVRAPKQRGFEPSDWAATMTARIAEAIDPAARAMAVLDKTIADVVASSPETRAELVDDLKSRRDAFRRSLGALHGAVLAQRARASRVGPTPAAALLESAAIRTPALWPLVVPLLLAHAAAEEEVRVSPPAFQAVSRARLALAAGLTEIPIEADAETDEAALSLQTDEAFVASIVRHWTTVDVPETRIAANGEWRIERARLAFVGETVGKVTKVKEVVQPLGVIDLARVPRDKGPVIEIALRLDKGNGFALPATIPIALETTLEKPAVESVQRAVVRLAALDCQSTGTTLTVTGGPTSTTPATSEKVWTGGLFKLRFDFSNATSEAVPAEWTYTDDSAFALTVRNESIDVVNAGRLTVRVGSSKAIVVRLPRAPLAANVIRPESLNARNAQALRGALSLAFAGPAIGGLTSGFVPDPSVETELSWIRKPLHERLPEMIRLYTQKSFERWFDMASGGLDGTLAHLFFEIRNAAVKDAARLAQMIVPRPREEEWEPINEEAPPLAFLIDQLQDFDDTFDLWERLAGLGVLLGREGSPNLWWSLNAATIHKTALQQREPLGETNAIRTSRTGDWTKDWRTAARVNPVPLVVGESNGVRSALVRYENHSIVGQMDAAPELDPAGAAPAPRRPEAFLFPTTGFVKLPPLTFGRTYFVVPYAIAHGGGLPHFVRSVPNDPVTLRATGALGEIAIDPKELELPVGTDYDLIRSKTYLRTVPVGPPRLAPIGTEWPGTVPGVDPLADELPSHVPPITLPLASDAKFASPARFFLDKEQVRGILMPPDPDSGLQIDIPRIAMPAAPAGKSIAIEVVHFPNNGAAAELALRVDVKLEDIRKAVGNANDAGLRLQIVDVEKKDDSNTVKAGSATVFALALRDHVHADDEPEVQQIAVTASNTPLEMWRFAYVRLSAMGETFAAEPPAIQWGSVFRPEMGAPRFIPGGTHPTPAPEAAHASRKVAVLDGIRVGQPTGATTARLVIRRPAVSLATYDRWINFPLSAASSTLKTVVGSAINEARKRTIRGKDDRSLDDPAVEALFVEVVQRFPSYQVLTTTAKDRPGPQLLARLDGADPAAVLSVENDLAKATITVDPKGPLAGSAKIEVTPADPTKNLEARLSLTLVPGRVYDLRIYGGVPAKQNDLYPSKDTAARFSSAARAGWRELIDAAGGAWHLGAPLALTVEVATELMPEIALTAETKEAPFAVDLATPPRMTPDRALVRLVPERIGPPIVDGAPVGTLRYTAMRCVNRLALMDQRWSWRGRPQPEWPFAAGVEFGTKGTRVRREIEEFIDCAFADRSVDDIGTIREATIGRGHASGGRPTMIALDAGSKEDMRLTRPVALSKDLDYRGGANLWRLALRLTSRYEAMRTNHPAMVRFSHRREGLRNTTWWPFIVPDHPAAAPVPRKIERPSLMLVLPLTEPATDNGAVPPLLAVFNQELFPLFNAADGIETVVDVARHPFIVENRIARDKKPQTGGTETYGELFDKGWAAVDPLREKLDDARATLRAVMRLASTATQEMVTKAGEGVETARRTLEKPAAALNLVILRGEAWGREQRLAKLLRRAEALLKEAENSKDPDKIKRATEIRDEYVKLHAAALKEATELEKTSPAVTSEIPGDPTIRYWPETGPDPIRTGTGATGRPLAIRTDGPIGYTFDLETEAGGFGHAAMLVSPAAVDLRPWSFIKLRFRRCEVPELAAGPQPPSKGEDEWPNPPCMSFDAKVTGTVAIRLSSSSVDLAAIDINDVLAFRTVHEGIALDLMDVERSEIDGLRFSFCRDDAVCANTHTTIYTRVESKDNVRRLVIEAVTHLGRSGRWSMPLGPGARAGVRMIVSQRPKPNGDDRYRPIGDVSVRVRITGADQISPDGGPVWLAILCMPLTAENKPPIAAREPVLVYTRKIASSGKKAAPNPEPGAQKQDPETVTVRPVRLSDFTPGVWCQFASVMSRLHMRAATDTRPVIEDLVHVSQLSARRKDERTLTLGVDGLRPGETLTELWLRSETDADADAGDERVQIEEPLYAIVTRYVHDAFDLKRERPMGIHRVAVPHRKTPSEPDQSTLDLGERVWSPPGAGGAPYRADMSGRVRFVRVLRGRTKDQGGFEELPKEFPASFFSPTVVDAQTDDPIDAPGLALGISQPIEWKG